MVILRAVHWNVLWVKQNGSYMALKPFGNLCFF